MAEVAFAVPIIFGAGGMLKSVNNSNTKEDNVFTLQAWDPFSDYYKFDKQFNDMIDQLLMDPLHGWLGNKIPVSERSFMPGEGRHAYYRKKSKYYLIDKNYVNFYKKIKTHNGIEIVTYYCKLSLIAKLFKKYNAFSQLMKALFRPCINTIRITSIDTSHGDARIYVKNQIYKNPTPLQTIFADFILNYYHSEINNNNIKVFISGKRGSQKTYMGKVVKKKLDDHPLSKGEISSTLIDNFNPKDIGVNIETMFLSKATRTNPLIILINEFDIIMNYVIDPNKQCFDPRLCHARDKNSFNNFLDNIADTRYCISIFTSETPFAQLTEQHEDFKSFLRKGRIDYLVSMNLEECKVFVP